MLFDELDFLLDTLKNKSNLKIIRSTSGSGNFSHAYIFSGNNIDHLLNIALLFSSAINCPDGGCGACRVCETTSKGIYENINLVEAQGNFITVDAVRALQKFMSRSSHSGGKKIGIIKEAELLSNPTANMLLKILEDPPDENCIFIILTEDISTILPTIVSRCLVFEWDLQYSEEQNLNFDPADFKELIHDQIKKMLQSPDDGSLSLDASLAVLDFLKTSLADKSGGPVSETDKLKNMGATKSEIKKYEDDLKVKKRRKQNKYNSLGINMVFDIITAWLEDIISVVAGANRQVLNFAGNYDIISKLFISLDNKKVFDLIDDVEDRRHYIRFSINPELLLDSLFLRVQQLSKK